VSLIITGNPGVGKHTIAKSLAKVLDYEIFDINKIALESKLYEKTNETYDVDIIKLKKILEGNNLVKKIGNHYGVIYCVSALFENNETVFDEVVARLKNL